MAAAIGGVARRSLVDGDARRDGQPLLVASSRSAVVRLAPVAAALEALGMRPAVAGLVDGLGHFAPPTLECFQRSTAEIVAHAEAALDRLQPSFAILAGD